MKILQWNIWYQENIENVLQTLKEIDPDVACLQEVTLHHPDHNPGIDTVEFLAQGLNYNRVFKDSQQRIIRGHNSMFGNAIFSRFPILKSSYAYITPPQPADDPSPDYSKDGRVYVEIEIQDSNRKIAIGTTHLSYTHGFNSTPEKEGEVDRLLTTLREKSTGFIFTGDINALPNSYTVEKIGAVLRHAGPDLSLPTWTTKPFSYNGFTADTLRWRLDYVFATPDICIRNAKIIDTPHSDHLPILIEIE